MNKYEQVPDTIIDLHGHSVSEVEEMLDAVWKARMHCHLRLITGKGNHGENGPVLRSFVKNYLQLRNIRYNTSKIQDGGDGALEVFF